MERYYTDGTEPTSLPHFDQKHVLPVVCRGWSCQQGRLPCATPSECVLEGDIERPGSELREAIFLALLLGAVSAVLGLLAGWLTS